MAMSTGGSGGSFNPEPNMTPMIDVLLVLLIIFMLIVPMARKAIDLQLPEPNPNAVASAQDNQQIVLEVSADGSYRINTQPVPPGGLDARLHEIYDNRPDKIIFVKGDTLAKYQTIIEAMDIARGAGVKVIGVPPKDVK
jgi:biopolymer transport protein TolR